MVILILAANVVVYLLMVLVTGDFSFSPATLVMWGGNWGVRTLHGEPWRMFTAMYLHEGFSHIAGNMVLLAISGGIVGARLTRVWFVLAYTVCGLAGNLLSALVHPDVVGIGASGAIAGVVGMMVTLYFSRRSPGIPGAWLLQIIVINGLYSFAPSVDGLAHLGGFVAGLVSGGLLLGIPGGIVIDRPAKPSV